MKYAVDKITGNRVGILRKANTGNDLCVVIQHPDGSTQIQFKNLLKDIK